MFGKSSKKAAAIVMLVSILFLSSAMAGFSGSTKRTIEISDVAEKILYNDKELQSSLKLFVYNNEVYMPMSFLRDYFNKLIEKDSSGRTVIKDKPDAVLEALKAEAAQKDAKIKELDDKVKQLEGQLAMRHISLEELESKLNTEYNKYGDLEYRVLLSGDENEVRVKLLLDLDYYQQEWSRLNSSKKLELLQGVCGVISGEYGNVKIKGYVKDPSKSRQLLSFSNNADGSLKVGTYKYYDKIGELEDKFNNSYDNVFSGIDLTYKLSGNENSVAFTACIQNAKYGSKWDKLSDYTVKNAMKRLCSDISAEFKDAEIDGFIYDMDSGANIAEAWMHPKGDLNFTRE